VFVEKGIVNSCLLYICLAIATIKGHIPKKTIECLANY